MYQFKFKWFNSDEQITEEVCGLVAGKNYQEALANLEKYTEGDFIIEYTLQELNDYSEVLTFLDNSFDMRKHIM